MEVLGFELPDELYYTDDHVWVRVEGGKVRMGLDSIGAKAIREVVRVKLRPVGSRLEKGKPFAILESAKWVGSLKSPVAGRVIEVNEKLKREPYLVNQDPYGEGWMVVVELEEALPIEELHHGEGLKEWAEKEVRERFKLV